jgi:hypothetical protein
MEQAMGGRRATEDELEQWRTEGWVVLEGLVSTEEIDAALPDLWQLYPTPEEYFADPESEKVQIFHSGNPFLRKVKTAGTPFAAYDQFVGLRQFPWPGSGALNRLAVHAGIVDFVERALETTDLRLYQSMTWAKYAGDTDYEQDHHTDLNHSWLPPITEASWRHVEGFLFLSDIDEGSGPTHVVNRSDAEGLSLDRRYTREEAPQLYDKERKATGVRGSYLAYRTDVFHRGANLTTPGSSRFLMNLSFRRAEQDWIGYHALQSRQGMDALRFIEASSPRELELVGFPSPGHPVWTEELVERTSRRYPGLDMAPWRKALTADQAP